MELTQSKLSKETTPTAREREGERVYHSHYGKKGPKCWPNSFQRESPRLPWQERKGRKKATTLETVESKRTANKTLKIEG